MQNNSNINSLKTLLLSTSKKLNSALARKNYEKAFALLQVSNSLRSELGIEKLTLPSLESKF